MPKTSSPPLSPLSLLYEPKECDWGQASFDPRFCRFFSSFYVHPAQFSPSSIVQKDKTNFCTKKILQSVSNSFLICYNGNGAIYGEFRPGLSVKLPSTAFELMILYSAHPPMVPGTPFLPRPSVRPPGRRGASVRSACASLRFAAPSPRSAGGTGIERKEEVRQ